MQVIASGASLRSAASRGSLAAARFAPRAGVRKVISTSSFGPVAKARLKKTTVLVAAS